MFPIHAEGNFTKGTRLSDLFIIPIDKLQQLRIYKENLSGKISEEFVQRKLPIPKNNLAESESIVRDGFRLFSETFV